MANITLKNIPDELVERLKERAAGERRSVNQQAIHLLEISLGMSDQPPRSKASERQVSTWRGFAGRWISEETVEGEIAAIYDARTLGRDVEL